MKAHWLALGVILGTVAALVLGGGIFLALIWVAFVSTAIFLHKEVFSSSHLALVWVVAVCGMVLFADMVVSAWPVYWVVGGIGLTTQQAPPFRAGVLLKDMLKYLHDV